MAALLPDNSDCTNRLARSVLPHGVPGEAQGLREFGLKGLRRLERELPAKLHEIRAQPESESTCVTARLIARPVLLKAYLGRAPGHADVHGGPGRIIGIARVCSHELHTIKYGRCELDDI